MVIQQITECNLICFKEMQHQRIQEVHRITSYRMYSSLQSTPTRFRCSVKRIRRDSASAYPGYLHYSRVELMISRVVSLCIEMPGNSYQEPPRLWLITESSM